jgi:EAL domain-containing protein (putative c-di-GMP-specific phosphodiesterase class I)
VVLCEDVDDEATVTVLADRLLSALGEPFVIDGQVFHVSASLGIALAQGSASRPDTLIRDADAAMYRAKDRRRGGYEIFNDDTRRRAVQRLHVENGLRAALEDGDLRVHYQPIVGVADGRVHGAEALLRWQHPEHGLIMPAHFIPVAEESGLIVPIGAWVLREACHQAAAWQRELGWSEPLEISVNLSARQLLHSDLLKTVTEVLDGSALDAHNVSLCIEVTESMVMEDPASSARTLQELKALGVRVGMDDFGTGYSSLAYLRRFPFDIIKIDREFVAELPSAEARAIIGSIVELAGALGLTAVAEGVETPEQLGVLRDVGCELAQGFLFARPQPGLVLTELLRSMNRQPV